MSDNNQAQADSADQLPVADPFEAAANSTTSGTSELDAYEQERQAFLASQAEDQTHGAEPAAVDPDEEEQEQADDDPEEQGAGESSEEISADEEESPGVKAQERFRFKDAADQAVAVIAKAKGISLIEAARLYEGDLPTQREDATEQTETAQEARDTAASVQERIEELEELEAQASEELEFKTANEHRQAANKLRNQLIDLKIAEVQERSHAAARENEEFNNTFIADRDKFLALYPDAAGAFEASLEKSAMAKEIIRLDEEMRVLGDPIHNSPKKAGILMKKAAVKLGIPMQQPGTAPAKPKVVLNRPIQPASGNARTTSADPNQRFETEIDKLDSLEDYERLVGRA